ncbi:LysR family transcriptional regulator [Burkholderia gladioli]|uniref:LysR family transcriptional regulator n=1 Tax=Burkholderia gladioli TaxID=28095 RepID=UPI000BBD2DEB|nr:LysR family transcriptional regulator [Burkholderia gladioli]ATF89041.1 LysR family transcriptional regulator [Burkholderia gladioli pv. gladioli]MBJ9712529.1 LysR family transcriptional regulator [Burkholderia gladioli]MBU9157601.1 LysR family transcriptional regulator [Burkholderia gladioli]MCH7274042.1 LysR family transcriptional regulator [Burkholderia gladioli]MDR8092736.1 LysR family transcriptional regulator [Burkholderia gladioli]
MIGLDLLASFAAAARHASFAAAARELGLSPSTIAKNIARLEARLGVRLFHRTTRQVTLSKEGEEIHARCRLILEEVESLETAAIEARGEVRGTLRIDMPLSYGKQVVMPVLRQLNARHPALTIDARFSDRTVDVVKDGLDAAIRIGPLADSSLVGRQFDAQYFCTYASPAYLEQHGEPASPDELGEHTCLLFRVPSTGRERAWHFRSGRRERSLTPDSRMHLGDGEALIEAAVAGLGLVQTPRYLATRALENGELVEVLKRHRAPPLPISLVYPSQRHVPLRVRVLLDALLASRRAARA